MMLYTIYIYLTSAIPITPHAILPPALPVVLDNSCPPLPKSSSFSCTTNDLPMTLCCPTNEIWLSVILTCVSSPLDSTLPKSPTWRSLSSGPPCVLPVGLKCAPAVSHPLLKSPNWWTWNPCLPAGKLFSTPVILVGPPVDCCSNVITPVTAVIICT